MSTQMCTIESIRRANLCLRQRKCPVGQRPAKSVAPVDLVFHHQFELLAHARHSYQPGSRQARVDLAEVHGGHAEAKLRLDHPLVHVKLQTVQPAVGVRQVLERLLEAPKGVVETNAFRALPIQNRDRTVSVHEQSICLPRQAQSAMKERYLRTEPQREISYF